MENRLEAVEQKVNRMEAVLAEVYAGMKELLAEQKMKKDVVETGEYSGISGAGEGTPTMTHHARSRSPRHNDGFDLNHRGACRRLEIPVFKGDDPHGWLVQVERYFRVNQVREGEKLDAVVIALEERALNWFQWWEQQAPVRTWGEFKNAVIRRFFPESLHNLLGPLLSLRQEGTVMEYREKFELHVAPLAREDRVMLEDIFLNGLKDEIKAEIKLYNYDDLSSLMDRALLLEEKNLALNRRNKGMSDWKGGGSRFCNTWDSSRVKKEDSKVLATEEEKEGSKQGGNVKNRRLPTSEWEEKMKLGLCFKCGDKWMKGHVCKFKHMKLMLVETGSESEEEEGELGRGVAVEEVVEELKTLQLSLHSKEGLTSNKSFKVWGEIDGRLILTLLDSGASSNFISPRLVKALSLQVFDTPMYVVEIGTGEKVQNQGICRNLRFRVQGIEFQQNFFLMELGGTDMVLGMDWLAGLGDVEANFRNLSLKWRVNGEKMTIQGEPSLCNAEVSW